MQPMQDKVIIRVSNSETVLASGLIMQSSVVNDTHLEGVVTAIGEGQVVNGKRLPMTVKVGDTVIFLEDNTVVIKVDNVPHYVIPEKDILAIK